MYLTSAVLKLSYVFVYVCEDKRVYREVVDSFASLGCGVITTEPA